MNTARNRSTVPRSENGGKEIVLPSYRDVPARSCASLYVSISASIDHESGCLSFSLENPGLWEVASYQEASQSSECWLQLAFNLIGQGSEQTLNAAHSIEPH